MKLDHKVIRPNVFKVLNYYLDRHLTLQPFVEVKKTLEDLFPDIMEERFQNSCEISESEFVALNKLGIIPAGLECILRELAKQIFIKLPSNRVTVGIISLPLEKELEKELAYPSDHDSMIMKESGQCIYLSCFKMDKDVDDSSVSYNMSLVMEYKIV